MILGVRSSRSIALSLLGCALVAVSAIACGEGFVDIEESRAGADARAAEVEAVLPPDAEVERSTLELDCTERSSLLGTTSGEQAIVRFIVSRGIGDADQLAAEVVQALGGEYTEGVWTSGTAEDGSSVWVTTRSGDEASVTVSVGGPC